MSNNGVVRNRVPASPSPEGVKVTADALVGKPFYITSVRFFTGRLGEFAVVEGADDCQITPEGEIVKAGPFWFTTGGSMLLPSLHAAEMNLPALALLTTSPTSSGHMVYRFEEVPA